jgi:hypothetical protein
MTRSSLAQATARLAAEQFIRPSEVRDDNRSSRRATCWPRNSLSAEARLRPGLGIGR